jgi:uncharacterized protein (TIGR03083 family)
MIDDEDLHGGHRSGLPSSTVFDQAYLDVKARVLEIARSLDADQLAAKVPATPLWSGQDVVAHLTGVAADIVNGRMENAPQPVWTEPQVAGRTGRTLDELAAEWDEHAPEVARRLAAREIGLATIFDSLTHEADLREAYGLGRPPGDVVGLAVAAVGKQLVKGYADAPGGLLLRTEDGQWRLGSGDPTATADVSTYELFRAIFSRRSRAQLKAWSWHGDPSAYVDTLPIFGPRDDDQPVARVARP